MLVHHEDNLASGMAPLYLFQGLVGMLKGEDLGKLDAQPP